MIDFHNTYSQLPPRFYERIKPVEFPLPQLIIFNEPLARELGIAFAPRDNERLAKIFAGQLLLPGSEPLALAYAGHQFGQPVPQLGDGRAHLLGETAGFDLQLKGSGPTKFSRQGDGRSALGPVLREYIVSEAMHSLGVPTTRALCAVATGENVLRQFGPEPGGVLTRIAASHLRVGTFQYFAFQQDLEACQILLDYTIARHYPLLATLENYRDKAIQLLVQLSRRQAELVAHWSSLGFIHGVMNTDNFSLAGITIDYGPCAFMDEFHFKKVFSSIDRRGRYSFENQVPIAKWNILRLADCLLPLIDEDQQRAIAMVEGELAEVFPLFEQERMAHFGFKLGIDEFGQGDELLVSQFLDYLETEKLDFTLSFRNLPQLYNGDFTGYPETQNLKSFVKAWQARVKSASQLNQRNPQYIPRNHQIAKAIKLAYAGDFEHFYRLNEVLKKPFEAQDGYEEFAEPPSPTERVTQTFCGT